MRAGYLSKKRYITSEDIGMLFWRDGFYSFRLALTGRIWAFCLSSRYVGVNGILDDCEIDCLKVGLIMARAWKSCGLFPGQPAIRRGIG